MDTHETYVSIETAKLLKKAGFDWECSGHWVETNKDNKDALLVLPSEPCLYGLTIVDIELSSYMGCIKDWNSVKDEIGFQFYYSAPTLAVAHKWLREKKGCYISVNYDDCLSHYWVELFVKNDNDGGIPFPHNVFDTYEEALEASIKKCLKILEG